MEALWILIIPLSWLVFAKFWLHTTFNIKEFAIVFVGVALLTIGGIQLSKWGAKQDTEIWNGQAQETFKTGVDSGLKLR